jgi:Carboxypeptidase regulatory-like domain
MSSKVAVAWRLIVASAGFAVVAAAHIGASPADAVAQQNQHPRPTSLVIGRVIDGATGKAVTGVIVTLSGAGIRAKRVIVDPQGRFLFHELPAGAFNIKAVKPGFLDGAYGVLRPDGTARSLELTDGERLTDVTVRMWPYGTISGTVTDDAGDPVAYASVQALRRTIVAGKWRLVNIGATGAADERGVYRITGLVPGEYGLVITSMVSTLPPSLLDVATFVKTNPGDESSRLARELTTNGAFGFVNDLMQGFPVTRVGEFMMQNAGNLTIGSDGKTIESYPTVWYPSAPVPAEASFVAVGPGDQRTNVDIRPRLTKALTVSGAVIGPDGPVPHLALRLVPSRLEETTAEITSSVAMSFTTAMTVTDASGRFTFLAVPSGQFVIRAMTSPRPPAEPVPAPVRLESGGMATTVASGPAPAPMVTTEPTFWAATPVSVGSTDTTGVTVSLRSGIRVTGSVEFTGAAAKPTGSELRALRISMEPSDSRLLAYPTAYQAQIDPTGKFYTIGLMAGRYLMKCDAAPRGWVLKSATVQGRDICDVPLALENADVEGLVITFTDRPSVLSGFVHDSQGKAQDDASVLVFPTGSTWIDHGSSPRRLRGVRASRSGAFSFSNLPAGDYYLVAVNDAVASNWQDPAFLAKLARLAMRVSIGDGQSISQNLTTVGGIVR